MAETGSVFIWVQHLLGIGHLMRMAHLARYLATQGWSVDLVSGGAPVPALDTGRAQLHQLPPLRAADSSFSSLVDADDKPIDDAFKARRRDLLLRLFTLAEPDVLIVEHYPFGRSPFRFELDTLLAAAAHRAGRPLVLASVRDVLVQRRAERQAETVVALERAFDGALVHSDPSLVPLQASFAAVPLVARKLFYTGYIGGLDQGPPPPPGDGENEVIVSAGGGAVGNKLATIALEAACALPYVRRWRILVGANAGPRLMRKLTSAAPRWVTVEPTRRDFRGLLARAAVSVSQAGYNTVVDVLAAGVRSVLVPFASDRETEQTLRAACLERRGLARVVAESALTADRLAALVAEALALRPPKSKVKLDGEAETERILRKMLASRREKNA